MHWKTSHLVFALVGLFALAIGTAAYFNANHLASASSIASNPAGMAPSRGGPERMTIPSGTRLDVRLDQAVSSRNAPGSEFLATVSDPVVVNGVTVIPRGARAHGTVLS